METMTFPTNPRPRQSGLDNGNQANSNALPPLLPARLPLMRPKKGRWLVGVCKGVSLHVGLPVALVRLLFLLAVCLYGAGLFAYVFLWVMVPAGDPIAAQARLNAQLAMNGPLSRGNASVPNAFPSTAQDGTNGSGNNDASGLANDSDDARTASPESSESLDQAFARAPKPALIALAGITLIAVALLMDWAGVDPSVIMPLIVGLIGVGVAWIRFGQTSRQLPTLLIGIALIFGAYALFVMNSTFLGRDASPRRIIAGGLVMLIFAGFAVVPWAGTMVRNLSTERASKEREEERADMTAHLHDGVLQTLALIQLHSEEPETVFTLARQQERELREWLYQTRSTSDRSVSAGIKDIAAHVEDEHGKAIEVVTVGDARPSAATDALLDATTQALVNAVTHGGEPVSVYCEAGANQVDVFVRDHGEGFDIEAIPADRLGIRESIIGRVRRRGGTVDIVSRPGWGTEVRMHMPIATGGDRSRQHVADESR